MEEWDREFKAGPTINMADPTIFDPRNYWETHDKPLLQFYEARFYIGICLQEVLPETLRKHSNMLLVPSLVLLQFPCTGVLSALALASLVTSYVILFFTMVLTLPLHFMLSTMVLFSARGTRTISQF
jgi:hypothetical protein